MQYQVKSIDDKTNEEFIEQKFMEHRSAMWFALDLVANGKRAWVEKMEDKNE